MHHSGLIWGRAFIHMSCPANGLGNFSKCFTATHMARLTFSPSSQQPTNNTSSCSTGQKEYWDILEGIKCKLKLQDMGFIPIRVHVTQVWVSVGLIPVKPAIKENVVQAFFYFIPWYPPSIMGKNREKCGGAVVGAFQNFQIPPKQWRKESTGNILSNHTKIFRVGLWSLHGFGIWKARPQVCVMCID